MKVRVQIGLLFAALLLLPFPAAHAQTALSANTIPRDQLIQPEQLNRELQAHPRDLLILQVGSHVLFQEAHILGSEYAGPASRPAGLDELRARVTRLPRNRSIVIYCGCCPWDKCPNIAPAWQLLHQMGFTHVRALYIANNFGSDWVARGYPAEKPQ